jgi:hypothetical protein
VIKKITFKFQFSLLHFHRLYKGPNRNLLNVRDQIKTYNQRKRPNLKFNQKNYIFRPKKISLNNYHVNINVITILYLKCVYVMSLFYFKPLYSHVIFKKDQWHVKIMSIRDKKWYRKLYKGKNILFLSLKTKIKFCYNFINENLI